MSTVRISRKAAVAILADYDSGSRLVEWRTSGAYQELRKALAPKPKPQKKLPGPTIKQAKAKKKRSRRDETREIYEAVAKRADGRCEACSREFSPLDPPEMDHQLGKKHARQSVENCWLIHGRSCHRMKHAADPSRLVWLKRIAAHARTFGHRETLFRVEAEVTSEMLIRKAEQGRGVAP